MKKIFINCPYDKDYESLLYIMIYTTLRFNHEPVFAFSESDEGDTRIEKIVNLINETEIGFHDISRCECIEVGEHYRLNMPFELGIDYGNRVFKNEKNSIVILESSSYRHHKTISDLSGIDVLAHNNEPEKLVKVLRDWFVKKYNLNNVVSPISIAYEYYDGFNVWLYEKLVPLDYSEANFMDELSNYDYIQYVKEYFKVYPSKVIKQPN